MTLDFKKTGIHFSILPLLGLLLATPSFAQKITLKTQYSTAYLGIAAGLVEQNITIHNDKYSISGSAKSNSFISLFAKLKANYTTKGIISGTQLIPTLHHSSFKTNKKRGAVNLAFDRGDVKKITLSPNKKPKPDTIPLLPDHMKNVIDPASAILFPVKEQDIEKGDKICNRTLPVFTGKSRLNLVYSYKSTQTASTEGFQGKTFTCAVRYRPVSGFRPHKEDVKFMRANRDMHITFARVGDTNLYTVFAFHIKTRKGTATGKAKLFAMDQ